LRENGKRRCDNKIRKANRNFSDYSSDALFQGINRKRCDRYGFCRQSGLYAAIKMQGG
jgi:hypothetical protein